MKKYVVISTMILLGLSVFANDGRLPGSSIADTKLQADTIGTVYAASSFVLKSNCTNFNITNTILKSKPEYNKVYQGKRYASSKWKEDWVVNACGRNVVVPVEFIPDKTGLGTTFMITPENIQVK
mgnify:FL=1